jgi:DNA-directed RNA polymerase specialized sigma24 family protein
VPEGERATLWLLAVARNLSRNTDRGARREQALIEPSIEPEDVPGLGGVEDGVVAREQLREALGGWCRSAFRGG